MIDSFIYEARPWIFSTIGLVTLYYSSKSPILVGSGLLLILGVVHGCECSNKLPEFKKINLSL